MQKITANVPQTRGFAVGDHPLLFCEICACEIECKFAVPSTAFDPRKCPVLSLMRALFLICQKWAMVRKRQKFRGKDSSFGATNFFFENTCALCPCFLDLASSISVFGLEWVCPQKVGSWSWPRDFFESLALTSKVWSSTQLLAKTILNDQFNDNRGLKMLNSQSRSKAVCLNKRNIKIIKVILYFNLYRFCFLCRKIENFFRTSVV